MSFGLSSARTTEAVDPPRKPATTPKPRHVVFEGDAAAIELRSRLAKARDGALLPVPRDASAPAIGRPVFGAVLRFTGIVLTAAAVAGVAGYLAGGVKPSFKLAQIAALSGEAEAPPTPVTLAAQLTASNRDAPLPAAQTAAIDLAPAGVRRSAGNDTWAARAAQRPGPPATPPLSRPPPLPPPDASEIAARLKLGAILMAAGDIAGARMVFARVADTGEAAGAFALAETYDPAVLGTIPLHGGITPDPAQARRWYEKAREMGSSAAPERIARLAARMAR